jgi:recombination protein RecA
MPVAAQIRAEIEAVLARRIPSALTPVPRAIRPTVATGIPPIDELLGGGLPIGAITEISGQECSGRTSLALAFLGQITRQSKVAALVDVSDTLHPESAAAAGVDLAHMLWVRCGGEKGQQSGKYTGLAEVTEVPQTTRVHLGGNSPHPRSEEKGMPLAIADLLGSKAKYKRNKSIGTPGAPNRPFGTTCGAEAPGMEQVASDRLPARRGSYVLEQHEAYKPRCAEPQRKPRPEKKSYGRGRFTGEDSSRTYSASDSPMHRLEQALRVTDLLLQAGGFSAIVLDMGSISPEHVSRIPLATWYRYRAAAEHSQSSFVLLTQRPCAKSIASVVLRLDNSEFQQSESTVFTEFIYHVELLRRRHQQDPENLISIRKPPQRADRADWRSGATWAMQREAGRR